MKPTTTVQVTTKFADRREYGIPYGPLSAKDARRFAKTAGRSTGALLVEVKGKGTYVGFLPSQEFAAVWLGAEDVKSVTILLGKDA